MGVLSRILLRYLTGPLIAIGLILPEDQQAILGDPEIVSVVATLLGMAAPAIAEGYYFLAKRYGWRT